MTARPGSSASGVASGVWRQPDPAASRRTAAMAIDLADEDILIEKSTFLACHNCTRASLGRGWGGNRRCAPGSLTEGRVGHTAAAKSSACPCYRGMSVTSYQGIHRV